MIITYPVGQLVDDAGTILSAPVVTVASVTDKAGNAIASPNVTINASATATPISFDYDAELHGEAWVTVSVSQSAHTVTGPRATIPKYASRESGRVNAIQAALTDADVVIDSSGLTGTLSVYQTGTTHIVGNLLYQVALSRPSISVPFSFDRV